MSAASGPRPRVRVRLCFAPGVGAALIALGMFVGLPDERAPQSDIGPAAALPLSPAGSPPLALLRPSSAFSRQVAAIAADEAPASCEELINALLAACAAGGERSALTELDRLGPEFATLAAELRARLVRIWAARDPRTAAAWVMALPGDAAQREGLLGHVGIVWANDDLPRAVLWADTLASGPLRNAAVEAVAGEAVRVAPLSALQLVVAQSPSPARDALVRRAAMEWAVDEPERAAEWGAQIKEDALRDQVLTAVALAWSERDAPAAAVLLAGEPPVGERVQADLAVGIAQRWAQHDPARAAAWVEAFPAGETRLAAIENVAGIWAAHDHDQAERWLRRLTATPRGH